MTQNIESYKDDNRPSSRDAQWVEIDLLEKILKSLKKIEKNTRPPTLEDSMEQLTELFGLEDDEEE